MNGAKNIRHRKCSCMHSGTMSMTTAKREADSNLDFMALLREGGLLNHFTSPVLFGLHVSDFVAFGKSSLSQELSFEVAPCRGHSARVAARVFNVRRICRPKGRRRRWAARRRGLAAARRLDYVADGILLGVQPSRGEVLCLHGRRLARGDRSEPSGIKRRFARTKVQERRCNLLAPSAPFALLFASSSPRLLLAERHFRSPI